jgi:hypothetical protein
MLFGAASPHQKIYCSHCRTDEGGPGFRAPKGFL